MIKIFGEAEPRVLEQLERCIAPEEGSLGVLCADNHLGYSQPIGGVVAYEDHISPSGVGYDIACGNAAARMEVKAEDVDIPKVMDEITNRIAFGMGRSRYQKNIEDPVLDKIKESPVKEQAALFDLAYNQLGTVGSGNHYVDLFKDEEGWLWVGVHFGSRGFGHRTASGFMAMAQGMSFNSRPKDGEMDAPPILIPIDTYLGQAYIEAMQIAGEYAYAGRNYVISRVLDIFQTGPTAYIHNHHNFAWLEEHDGRKLWVVRKGATPAQPGQQGFVGGSMGEISVILEGVDTPENREGLYSTVHGAGRVMSRMQAKGKMKKGKVIRPGAIDWPATQQGLRDQGIVLKGGGADEAPGVYKNLPEVLIAHGDTIRILHTLQPLGVAMAGPDIVDPYKD